MDAGVAHHAAASARGAGDAEGAVDHTPFHVEASAYEKTVGLARLHHRLGEARPILSRRIRHKLVYKIKSENHLLYNINHVKKHIQYGTRSEAEHQPL